MVVVALTWMHALDDVELVTKTTVPSIFRDFKIGDVVEEEIATGLANWVTTRHVE